jgi:carbon monoxide dehydrogenase subunit G
MISLREEIAIPAPPDRVWPLLSNPAVVASCIPGAELTKTGEGGAYQGTMRLKFGPTVATFRGEAKLVYDHYARRCTIEGRGIDGRGASRANASGVVTATGMDETVLTLEGQFHVTGPLETFANAGGVHLARAILAEFAGNIAKLVADQTSVTHVSPDEPTPHPRPFSAGGEGEPEAQPRIGKGELRAGSLLWRALLAWLRQLFSGTRQIR